MSGKPFSSLPLHTPKKRNTAHRCSSFFGGVFLNQNDEYREKGNPTPIKNGTIITIFYYIYTLYS